jgi:hypothetical protein
MNRFKLMALELKLDLLEAWWTVRDLTGLDWVLLTLIVGMVTIGAMLWAFW